MPFYHLLLAFITIFVIVAIVNIAAMAILPLDQKSWRLLGFLRHWRHQINKGVKTDNLVSQQMEKVIEAGIVLKELPIIKRG